MLKRIVSGGQTGVDRAAVDVAIDCNFSYGGYIPQGRLAEDGKIPLTYSEFKELDSKDYSARTKKNIEHSDGTVIIHNGKMGNGTRLTIDYAEKTGKPILIIDLSKTDIQNAKLLLKRFVEQNSIEVLSVAGPRQSISPEIYNLTYNLIKSFLSD
ncbi:conserved hypothetical protein [Thermotomaculum hydrothermale]|uniref:Molybdenum carrier n=1 Tax=Thermotomaculum hydrothermale TaxID=981385 RepID=A0A7R6PUM1_9BACT|nr:putative molybdenum carrier protein [Thermotomaculum hydrothermale]BBB32982.1 conserved hypothetical protein [Thermotomaculum hydrothermale]